MTSSLQKEDLGPALLVVAWLFASISLIVLIVRTYVRVRIVQHIHLDDWLIYLTFILAVCDSTFCTLSVRWGLGKHIQFLSPEQIQYSVMYIYICEGFTIMSPCFGRISYALLLLQLVPIANGQRKFLRAVIWTQFVVDVGTVIITFSQCRPISAFWGPEAHQHCWNPVVQQYTGFFQGSVCSLVDLILALFPASLFWKLQMKTSTKVSLSFLMGLGAFAMIFSITKTIKLQALAEKGDPTYALGDLAIWFTLEAYMVLLAASVPTLRPVARKIGARSGQSKGRSSSVALCRTNHVSKGSRENEVDQFHILEEDLPSWSEEGRHNRTFDVGLSNTAAIDHVSGITKTTTVTVLDHNKV